ncbi:MAG TPA: hypothetical protein VI583_06820, partial [Cyclobacteriaceae bacterium]|nr:hypothetical protein [Cyclobacteriaceae bacterium]
MRKTFIPLLLFVLLSGGLLGQDKLDSIIPVRGICLGAPSTDGVDKFVSFINDELVKLHVNTLVILIDYGYEFKSHP